MSGVWNKKDGGLGSGRELTNNRNKSSDFTNNKQRQFSTKLNTRFWFGTSRDVSMAGLQIDVDKCVIAVNE